MYTLFTYICNLSLRHNICSIQINADLKSGVDKLTSALQAGSDPRVAARDFLGVLINGLRRMEGERWQGWW